MVTMQDVADRAGVALSTVSVALNGTRPVAPATRDRIERAMAELGYARNAVARALARRRSSILALTYPVESPGLSTTVMEFLLSAAQTARDRGYHLVLWPFPVGEAVQMTNLARQGLADGVLVMEVALDDPRVRALRAAQVPMALIGRTAQTAGLSCVDIDFDRTTDEAVAHLVALGHERIAFLNHSAAHLAGGHGPTVRGRHGFLAAMARRGLEPVALECEDTVDGGRAAVRTLLGRAVPPTALVVMNEEAGFGAVWELGEQGLAIPEDVSVLSIVSSPGVGAHLSPPLTTMHAPGVELGRMGVDALLARLQGASSVPGPVLVPCHLVVGASTGPAHRRD